MLFTTKKAVSQIDAEIGSFLDARRRFSTTRTFRQYLLDFSRATGIERCSDITDHDIEAYAMSLKYCRGSLFQRTQAMMAVRLFMRFTERGTLGAYMQQEIKTEKKVTGRPRNDKLRDEMRAKRSLGWSFKRIGEHFDRAPSTVHEMLSLK